MTDRLHTRPKRIDEGVYEYGEWFLRWDKVRELWRCECQVEEDLEIQIRGSLGFAAQMIEVENGRMARSRGVA